MPEIIKMPAERSAGVILFRNTSRGRRYLVIRSSRNVSFVAKWKKIPEFWDLPKGIVKSGERGIDAALREAKEEVGIQKKQLVFAADFKVTVRYFTRREGKVKLKFVVFFLARAKTKKVKLSWEHDRYEWLRYQDAHTRLSLSQMREALKAAEKLISRHDRV